MTSEISLQSSSLQTSKVHGHKAGQESFLSLGMISAFDGDPACLSMHGNPCDYLAVQNVPDPISFHANL